MKTIIASLALLAVALPAAAQGTANGAASAASRLAAAPQDRDQVAFTVESVGKLLETSSAARQIEASKVPEALARQGRARELHAGARAALDAGDLARASALLTEARAVFFEGVRLAAPEEVTAKKLETDYNTRLESVKALLGAYRRVASEKGGAAKGVSETIGQIEKFMATAASHAQAGRYKEGRGELDRAYLVAKAGVSGLRSGDTLVRSLHFATREEEFHYEVDRNNTHQMLIRVLLEEKRAAERVDGMVQVFVARSQELRGQADAAAARRDYPEAIRLLEESTAELVKAIRNAGVFIPG
ncbi:MAG TPA: hypothetical protein PK375_10255 [Rhodocyclaceae bacterium]|nr:hypothetical protein [Rhodocyclaceae bacterium]HNH36290.1 hypothetical protein [Rhodocyclaceae bacterium]